MQKYQSVGEIAYIAQKRVLTLDFVQHHPVFFAAVSLRRVLRFWTGFWSFSHEYLTREPLDIPNIFFCTVLTLFMLRGIRRWWQNDPASALPYLLTLFIFPIPYYFTHSSMDYRQPIEPAILALIIIGIFGLQNECPSSTLDDETFLSEFASEETDDEPVAVAAMALAPIS
jgi:hypothetical protein